MGALKNKLDSEHGIRELTGGPMPRKKETCSGVFGGRGCQELRMSIVSRGREASFKRGQVRISKPENLIGLPRRVLGIP